MKARELMKAAQDAPDRLIARKVQFTLDDETAAMIEKSRREVRPPVSLNEWFREAARIRLAGEK